MSFPEQSWVIVALFCDQTSLIALHSTARVFARWFKIEGKEASVALWRKFQLVLMEHQVFDFVTCGILQWRNLQCLDVGTVRFSQMDSMCATNKGICDPLLFLLNELHELSLDRAFEDLFPRALPANCQFRKLKRLQLMDKVCVRGQARELDGPLVCTLLAAPNLVHLGIQYGWGDIGSTSHERLSLVNKSSLETLCIEDAMRIQWPHDKSLFLDTLGEHLKHLQHLRFFQRNCSIGNGIYTWTMLEEKNEFLSEHFTACPLVSVAMGCFDDICECENNRHTKAINDSFGGIDMNKNRKESKILLNVEESGSYGESCLPPWCVSGPRHLELSEPMAERKDVFQWLETTFRDPEPIRSLTLWPGTEEESEDGIWDLLSRESLSRNKVKLEVLQTSVAIFRRLIVVAPWTLAEVRFLRLVEDELDMTSDVQSLPLLLDATPRLRVFETQGVFLFDRIWEISKERVSDFLNALPNHLEAVRFLDCMERGDPSSDYDWIYDDVYYMSKVRVIERAAPKRLHAVCDERCDHDALRDFKARRAFYEF